MQLKNGDGKYSIYLQHNWLKTVMIVWIRIIGNILEEKSGELTSMTSQGLACFRAEDDKYKTSIAS